MVFFFAAQEIALPANDTEPDENTTVNISSSISIRKIRLGRNKKPIGAPGLNKEATRGSWHRY